MTMSDIPWDKEAEKELKRVPFFVRPLVRRKVEEHVLSQGGKMVTRADFAAAEQRFRTVMASKSGEELERMIPRPNEPGTEMVIVETCHHRLSDCPNVLINTEGWRAPIERWLKENDISERLRRRVQEERVLYHHKFRISISGCPNACSRPQIADIGITGGVRPEVDPAQCRICGACGEVCPDCAVEVRDAPPVFDRSACLGCTKCRDICPAGCISLSAPAGRLMLGGKLGRHPRLAQFAGREKGPLGLSLAGPEELLPVLAATLEDFLEHAAPGERFADYYARKEKDKQ